MSPLRKPAPRFADIKPYDPKYLSAQTLLSANENPYALPAALRETIQARIARSDFNRYPDPLANELREQIAEANGLRREQVLVGNGGDELLFNLTLAWGGCGRKLLNVPPTFTAFQDYARITDTEVVNVWRRPDFGIDEEALLERLSAGDIDYVIIASPNNPTGKVADLGFIKRLLAATDALVLVDEAYFEFAQVSALPLLKDFENLIVLRTLSKAYGLAGLRLGYFLAGVEVINELTKVRQPYSVNVLTQIVAKAVFEQRESLEPNIAAIVAERGRLECALGEIVRLQAFPSDANFILFRVDDAAGIWESLLAQGVLVRDLSREEGLKSCLRVTVGSAQENDSFLAALQKALAERNMI